MILHHVRLVNFGVYGGVCEFDLTPRSGGVYERPVILLHGKNGVGKTTFVEGIRLALHGPLALGSRLSQAGYRDHLLSRIHRSGAPDAARPDLASVELEFELVRHGISRTYNVKRSWRRSGHSVAETIRVYEGGLEPEDIAQDELDRFLRELVPSTAADLFFFDGERIDRLTSDSEAQELLADSVHRLLGLHLVDQLDSDLNYFIVRQEEAATEGGDREELQAVLVEIDGLVADLFGLEESRRVVRDAVTELAAKIEHLEQRLASEGGGYAKQYDKLKRERGRLRIEIEAQRRVLQEACGDVFPFAVAPTIGRFVLGRLGMEAAYERWRVSSDMLDRQTSAVRGLLRDADLLRDMGLSLGEDEREKLADAVAEVVGRSVPATPVSESEVFLNMSEKDRAVLSEWLERALSTATASFAENAETLLRLQKEYDRVEHQLALAPADLVLQPLIDALHKCKEKMEEMQERAVELEQADATTRFKLGQAEGRLRKLRERLAQEKDSERRVRLASRAQDAFRSYAKALKEEKLSLFETAVANRFNSLIRKETFVDRVHVNPTTFEVVLRRGPHRFSRRELSAGEKQLFAIATVWALRDVSGLPMPMIIDTPMGRLDSDHRHSILNRFLPKAAHQLVLLATDTEIDEDSYAALAPAISHGYQMDYDGQRGTTRVREIGDSPAPSNVFVMNEAVGI